MRTTLCHHPGCQLRAVEGSKYCSRHSADENNRKIFTKRGKSSQWHGLYNSDRWRKISREFLSQYPECAVCGGPAKIADHIVPHRGDLDLFYDIGNLQPMCWRCHSAKTLRENNFFKRG